MSGQVSSGFVFEKQGGREDSYFADRFEHKLNDRVRIWQSLEWLPQVDDFKDWILNIEIVVETREDDTYDNQPAAGRTENDFKLVAALAYKF